MLSPKSLVCGVADAFGCYALGQALRSRGPSYVRVVNYHGTAASDAAALDRQLSFYRQSFENCDMRRLTDVLEGVSCRPSIAVTFDDGYRSNFDIAAPLLERHGLTGWFFVSPGRLRGTPGERTIDGEDADDFMSAAELRSLVARGHVVGCHTHSHIRLREGLSDAVLNAEIVQSRYDLEALLGTPVETFCWVGGEEWSYSPAAHAHVLMAGYRFAFMTNVQPVTRATHPLFLQRTNIEANWPDAHVRFYLSGLMDLAYASKRRRLAARLAQAAPVV